jgi:hypothetical protein
MKNTSSSSLSTETCVSYYEGTCMQTSATSALAIVFVSVFKISSSFPMINSRTPPSLSCSPPALQRNQKWKCLLSTQKFFACTSVVLFIQQTYIRLILSVYIYGKKGDRLAGSLLHKSNLTKEIFVKHAKSKCILQIVLTNDFVLQPYNCIW